MFGLIFLNLNLNQQGKIENIDLYNHVNYYKLKNNHKWFFSSSLSDKQIRNFNINSRWNLFFKKGIQNINGVLFLSICNSGFSTIFFVVNV